MNSIDITGCIVTYHNPIEDLYRAIDSFFDSSINLSKSMVIVDNSRNDTLISDIKSKYQNNQDIHFVKNDKNLGFGTGHNIGYKFFKTINIESKYHAIINPDVFIHYDCLDNMFDFMEQNQDIGMSVPKMLNSDGTIQMLNKEFPNVFDLFIRRFLPSFILKIPYFQNRYNKYIRMQFGYNDIVDVPCASGAFMFFRSDLYSQICGFDENIFLHLEDAEISKRLWDVSKIKFLPNAVITHKWKRDNHNSIKITIITIKSAIYFFKKHGWKFW